MSASQISSLCALLPNLDPDIAAMVIGDLLAAVPRRPDDDPQQAGRALVRRLAEMRPRDLEEAMLAVQMIAAHAGATLCAQAAAALDPASREASRLRRDAAIQQRALATLQRALRRAQARPMLADAETGEERPTVQPARPAPAPRRRAAEARARAAKQAAEPQEPPAPFPPPDVFDGHPDLQRLAERWHTLPRWEDMTMQERRDTWGYKGEPTEAEDAQDAAA